MFRNVFRLLTIAHHSSNEQKRSFLTIVNQGFEAYRTTLGKKPGNFFVSILK
jgi:hypothetical protein